MPARVRTLLQYLLLAGAGGLVVMAKGAEKPVAPQATGPTTAVASTVATDADLLFDEPVGDPQFNNAPTLLPPNIDSVGFEATATSEFGDLIRLAGPTHFIGGITVTMSSQAIRSDFANFPGASAFGFTHEITLKIYAVDRRSGVAAPGTELARVKQSFLIPWRPAPDASVSDPSRPWRAADGNHYPGLAFNVNFDLASQALSLPAEVIVTVSFNTEHYGAAPLGVRGPYNYLHMGVTRAAPTRGTDVERDALFWKTTTAAAYSDGGQGGINLLRRDTGWASYEPTLRVNDSPYGLLSSMAVTLRNLPSEDLPTIAALVEASDLANSALDRSLWESHDHLRPLWGRLVFDLLAETAEQVSHFTTTETPITPQARAALKTIFVSSQALAETAMGDAIIAGGNGQRIARAQQAFEAFNPAELGDNIDQAITQFANAWREAVLAVR